MTQTVCGRYHRMTRVPWFGLAHRHFFTTTQNGSNNQVNESTLSLASTPLEIKNVIQNLICEKFSNPPDVWTLQKCCLPHTSNRIHVMMRVQSDSVFGSWGLFGCFKFQFLLEWSKHIFRFSICLFELINGLEHNTRHDKYMQPLHWNSSVREQR